MLSVLAILVFLIGELAKLIKQNGVDVGAKRLFSWLREKDT